MSALPDAADATARVPDGGHGGHASARPRAVTPTLRAWWTALRPIGQWAWRRVPPQWRARSAATWAIGSATWLAPWCRRGAHAWHEFLAWWATVVAQLAPWIRWTSPLARGAARVGESVWRGAVQRPRRTPGDPVGGVPPAGPPLALRIIPSRNTVGQFAAVRGMVQAMTTCPRFWGLGQRIVALEMVGMGETRAFLVRATSPAALDDLELQLRARYPQAEVERLAPADDPFWCAPHEAVSVRELWHPGPQFITLETFEALARGLDHRTSGPSASRSSSTGPSGDLSDPVLALLAALDHIPADTRVLAQLALTSARETWLAGAERAADQTSLYRSRTDEQWRQRQQLAVGAGGPSLSLLVLLTALVGAALALWHRATRGGPPPWPWLPGGIWSWLVAHAAAPATRRVVPPGHTARPVGVAPPASAPTALPGAAGLHHPLQLPAPTPSGPPLFHLLPAGLLRSPLSLAVLVGAILVIGLLLLVVLLRGSAPRSAAGGLAGGWRALGERRAPVYDPATVAHKAQEPGFHVRLRLIAIGPAEGVGIASAAAQHTAPSPFARGRRDLRRQHRALRDHQLDRLVAAYRPFQLAAASLVARPCLPGAARRLVPHPPRPRAGTRGRQQMDTLSTTRLTRRNAWTRGVRRSPMLLSASEVAALWHLPAGAHLPDLPGLHEREVPRALLAPISLRVSLPAGGSSLEAPPRTPRGETADSAARAPGRPLLLGRSCAAGHTSGVSAPADLVRSHTLVVAKTGKGKSSFLYALARYALSGVPAGGGAGPRVDTRLVDIPRLAAHAAPAERSGVVLLDPHGDLLGNVLGAIPPVRRGDVVVLDLADRAYPVSLNPLDVTLGRERDKAVEDLLLIFAHLWGKFWGPRMEDALRYTLKTLYEVNLALVRRDPQQGPRQQFTLLDVTPWLLDEQFRHAYLPLVADRELIRWWARYYAGSLDTRMRLEVINPVLTKMARFSSSRIARRIIGQGQSSLDLAALIQQRAILLINTARGLVGADTAALVGATVLGLLRTALEELAQAQRTERPHTLVLVDEFQTIPGADYAAMLAELRKFGAAFVLCTQTLETLEQVEHGLSARVLANTDHLFVFQVSHKDAHLLVPELDGVVDERDLINLPQLTCYAKVSAAGARLPLFSLTLDPPAAGDALLRQELVQASRERVAPLSAEAADQWVEQLATRHTAPSKVARWLGGLPLPLTEDRTVAGGAVDAAPDPPAGGEENHPASQISSGRTHRPRNLARRSGASHAPSGRRSAGGFVSLFGPGAATGPVASEAEDALAPSTPAWAVLGPTPPDLLAAAARWGQRHNAGAVPLAPREGVDPSDASTALTAHRVAATQETRPTPSASVPSSVPPTIPHDAGMPPSSQPPAKPRHVRGGAQRRRRRQAQERGIQHSTSPDGTTGALLPGDGDPNATPGSPTAPRRALSGDGTFDAAHPTGADDDHASP